MMGDAAARSAPANLAIDGVTFRLADDLELAKPRLNAFVVATTAAGYYLAAPTCRPCFSGFAPTRASTAGLSGTNLTGSSNVPDGHQYKFGLVLLHVVACVA